MSEPVALLPDPSERIAATYRNVLDQRMQGLPFVNPALAVEAVAFGPWEGRWLGVVVTPWSINLALAPYDPSAWQRVEKGGKRSYRFPAGNYEFIGATDEDLGELQLCSLFSPVLEFADHETARLVATLAREALFDTDNAEDDHSPPPAPKSQGPGSLAELERKLDQPMTRRELFRGRLGRITDDDRR